MTEKSMAKKTSAKKRPGRFERNQVESAAIRESPETMRMTIHFDEPDIAYEDFFEVLGRVLRTAAEVELTELLEIARELDLSATSTSRLMMGLGESALRRVRIESTKKGSLIVGLLIASWPVLKPLLEKAAAGAATAAGSVITTKMLERAFERRAEEREARMKAAMDAAMASDPDVSLTVEAQARDRATTTNRAKKQRSHMKAEVRGSSKTKRRRRPPLLES